MKILIITNHSYMLYRFRKELIENLMESHEVVLSMPFQGHEEDFMAMGLKCLNTKMDRRGINIKEDLKLCKGYDKLIREENPDIVITYSIKPNVYAGAVCAKRNIPYFVNVQGLGTAFQRKGLAALVTLMYKFSLRKAKKVFFENTGNAREFINRKIIKEDKTVVLSGAGINLKEYAFTPYPENDKIHFLYLGRIMKEKGIDELFAAFKRLYSELGDKVQLDLVGFYDDDYEAKVNELVNEGLAVFYGFQSEPRPYYASADCVVMPSYHEGLSNVLLEAAAMGRPIITTDIHGCKETVSDGESGLLCKVQDEESLYQKMKEFTLLTMEQRKEMGIKAREKIEKEFDKQKVVEKTVAAVFENCGK
ncbi:MAG: glycosyltransferase family 4 protein [Ruminococcaceae bacterium]|nr:glycosyltransferase family 4 protein [Oscillospiraceae bacterium]